MASSGTSDEAGHDKKLFAKAYVTLLRVCAASGVMPFAVKNMPMVMYVPVVKGGIRMCEPTDSLAFWLRQEKRGKSEWQDVYNAVFNFVSKSQGIVTDDLCSFTATMTGIDMNLTKTLGASRSV